MFYTVLIISIFQFEKVRKPISPFGFSLNWSILINSEWLIQ